MKIVNHTKWDTRAIIKLVYRVAQDELEPGQLKNRGRITIKYLRANQRTLGWCYYGTMRDPNVRMRLFLPREGGVDTVKLAQVIAHELGHAKGIKHRDMNNTRYGWVDGWKERYAYAKDFPIPAKVVVKPTLDDKRRKELVKAQDMVSKWMRKHKLAGTALKKWQKKVKTIGRRLETPTRPSASESPRSLDA